MDDNIIGTQFPHSARDLWKMYGSKGHFHTWFNKLAKQKSFQEGVHYTREQVGSLNEKLTNITNQSELNFEPESGQKGGVDFLYKSIKTNLSLNPAMGRPTKEIYITGITLGMIELSYGEPRDKIQERLVAHTDSTNDFKSDDTRFDSVNEFMKSPRLVGQALIQLADAQDKIELLEHSFETLTTGLVAKSLGFESATALNEALHESGYLYKQGKVWLPYARKIPKDCYQIKAHVVDKSTYHSLKWTLKGKAWIQWLIDNGLLKIKHLKEG